MTSSTTKNPRFKYNFSGVWVSTHASGRDSNLQSVITTQQNRHQAAENPSLPGSDFPALTPVHLLVHTGDRVPPAFCGSRNGGAGDFAYGCQTRVERRVSGQGSEGHGDRPMWGPWSLCILQMPVSGKARRLLGFGVLSCETGIGTTGPHLLSTVAVKGRRRAAEGRECSATSAPAALVATLPCNFPIMLLSPQPCPDNALCSLFLSVKAPLKAVLSISRIC